MKTIIVAANEKARQLGLKDELRVGWRCSGGGALFWGSCKNRDAFNKLLGQLRAKYGEVIVEDRMP